MHNRNNFVSFESMFVSFESKVCQIQMMVIRVRAIELNTYLFFRTLRVFEVDCVSSLDVQDVRLCQS